MMHLSGILRVYQEKDRCIFMENNTHSPEAGRLSYRIIGWEDIRAVEAMEEFVRHHENSHFLQLPRWAKVKNAWKWRGILIHRAGEIVGAMSVLLRPLPLGIHILYAPRGPVCDREDPKILAELCLAAEELAYRERGLLLMLDPDAPAGSPFQTYMEANGFSEEKSDSFDNIQPQHVMRLSLVGHTEESLLEALPASTRYKIRLAGRKGVQIRQYSGPVPDRELDAFSALMEQTGQRDHFIPRQKEYFRCLLRELEQEAVLYLAYLNGEPIAGTIGIYSGGKGWYLYGASANTHRETMPNYALQWEMICQAIRCGCSFYDMRGIPGQIREDDPLYGLYRFKKGFGAESCHFSGLLVRRYRPILASLFQKGMKIYRKVRYIIKVER